MSCAETKMSLQACTQRDCATAEDSPRQSSTRQTTAVAAAGVGASPRVRRLPHGKSPVARNSRPGRHGNQFQLTAQLVGRWRNTVAD